MRFLMLSLVLLGLLAGIGVIYFRHETQAAEQAMKLEQPSTQSRAVPVITPTLAARK